VRPVRSGRGTASMAEGERERAPRPARARSRPPPLHARTAASETAGRAGSIATLDRSTGPGVPLVREVARPISASLGIDVSSVRVHSNSTAAAGASALRARALAFGRHIFLGRGQRPTDLSVMAHEVAHVVQQQGAPRLQPWTPGGTDPYEQEAQRASAAVVRREPFRVRGHTGPRVQRLGIGDALDYIADKANYIPGFRMFTIILGVNPINMSRVERSAANVMRAVIEFIPGGKLITDALDNHGIFDKVGGWVDQQIRTLGMTGSVIKQAILDFLDSLSWRDIFHLGDVWDRAKRIFTEPIRRIIDFVTGLITGIIKFIKDAILMPLAKLAEGTPGWRLLIAVLGKNPVTGDTVPRTAETLIGGFMTLIGQQDVWQNMQKANAIGRAWTWFQGAMTSLIGFVAQIPSLFVKAFTSLELMDIVLVWRAFQKVAGVFGNFIVRFISWAGNAVWNLLLIIFEVVSPRALGYIKRTGSALKSILKNPLPFVRNLVKAAKLGFQNFADNFGMHLKAGLIEWLTGALSGVYIPKAFELGEIVKFVFSVLGLSWGNVRQKLVKVVGETAVKAMETGFDIVVTLVKEGPAAAWEKIKEQLSNLKDQVIGGITDFVIDAVTKKAVPKLIAMFIPGAGFISAIISIYDTVMVFVQKISKIIQVVTNFIDSIVAIAAGAVGAAAKRVETTLAGLLSLAINFLAGFAGLGKVADKIMEVINKVRAPIDKALDALINWIVAMAKKVFAKVFGKKEKDERTDDQKNADLQKAMQESEVLQKNETITDFQIKQGLVSIKQKYKMASLEFVVDSEDEAQETVHVEGKVNPPDSTTRSKRSKAGETAGFTLSRPSFKSETLETLKEDYPELHRRGAEPLLKKNLARRHIVSSKDMAEHYESTLIGTKWAVAKELLETKGGAEARVEIAAPLGNKTIHAGAKERHRGFFNYTENLFVGDRFRNSAIGRAIDPDKPGMGKKKLSEHIALIKRTWALGPFTPTELEE
jgi:hypothetical protein